VAVAALALGFAAGCKPQPGGELPEVSGEKIAAKKAQVAGFGLVAAYPDQQGDTLALALEFSKAAGRHAGLRRPAEGDRQGRRADQGQLGPRRQGRRRRPRASLPARRSRSRLQRVDRGKLTAADGRTLKEDIRRTVHTGPLDPVVGFASQGSVLPARESRGLPVVSINVPEVDVEFLRIKDNELPRFFAEFQRGGRRGTWDLERDYSWDDDSGTSHNRTPLSKLAEPVYVNRFTLGGKTNERVLTYLPLQDITELQKPGLYFAVMKRTGQFTDQYDTAFFTVSDLGLHTRAYKDRLFVHAASLQTGGAQATVELKVLDAKGEAILKASTDRNGNALAAVQTRRDALSWSPRTGTDVSMLPFNQPALDLSEFAVRAASKRGSTSSPGRVAICIAPAKPSASPRCCATRTASPSTPRASRRNRSSCATCNPDGKALLETPPATRRARLRPPRAGDSRDAATGRWRVEFRTDPSSKEAVQGMTLRIEEFLPERMKLDLDAPARLAFGQPLQAQGHRRVSLRRARGGNPLHRQARRRSRTTSRSNR
jgi:uncharacterized protein YfaS (alpha-2-macroglobulin family)